MNIEMALKEDIGDLAGKLHTGKSRNDQVATDLKIWIRENVGEIIKLINIFQKILIKKSEENLFNIMPGFTHLQNAQPISVAHYFLAFLKCWKGINKDLKIFLTQLMSVHLVQVRWLAQIFIELIGSLYQKV